MSAGGYDMETIPIEITDITTIETITKTIEAETDLKFFYLMIKNYTYGVRNDIPLEEVTQLSDGDVINVELPQEEEVCYTPLYNNLVDFLCSVPAYAFVTVLKCTMMNRLVDFVYFVGLNSFVWVKNVLDSYKRIFLIMQIVNNIPVTSIVGEILWSNDYIYVAIICCNEEWLRFLLKRDHGIVVDDPDYEFYLSTIRRHCTTRIENIFLNHFQK